MAIKQLDNILSSMATEKVTTLEQLYDLQKIAPPSNALLPFADNIYDIDLNTRTINGPEVISVQRDHKAEVVYFKVDRYYDYMDLTNTICVIEYIIPGDKDRIPHLYPVPFYDTTRFLSEDKIIFPWSIGGAATSQEGYLEYAIRFYHINDEDLENKKLSYNLNMLPAKSKILKSLEADGEIMKAEYDIPLEAYEELLYHLKNNKTYWTIL